MDPNSPVETPPTPSPASPIFPTLPRLNTSFSFLPNSEHQASASPGSPTPTSTAAKNLSMRRRNSSIISITSSPTQQIIQGPLPVRPAKMAKRDPLCSPPELNTTTTASPSAPTPTQRPHHTKIRKPKRIQHLPPPPYHLSIPHHAANHSQQAQAQAQTHAHPSLPKALSHLRTPLVPLISVTTGLAHPSFPRTLLQFHLLTHAQLDDLAAYYHQVSPPVPHTWRYPTVVPAWIGPDHADTMTPLPTKRRRWGRFIGLRGCESPVVRGEGEGGLEGKREAAEALVERMEREWTRATERRGEEEGSAEKGWRGRW